MTLWGRTLDPVRDNLAARFHEAGREVRLALPQRLLIGRADDEIGADPALPEEGVGANLAALMRALDLGEQLRHLALRGPAADRPREQRAAALDRPRQGFEHQ